MAENQRGFRALRHRIPIIGSPAACSTINPMLGSLVLQVDCKTEGSD